MQCDQARKLFSAWLDQQLNTEETSALQQHLENCAACRGEWAAWQRLSHALQGIRQDVAAPDGFAAGVMATLNRTHCRQSRWSSEWKRIVAAAAAVVVITGSSLGWAVTNWWQTTPLQIAEHLPGSTPGSGVSPAGAVLQPAPATPDGARAGTPEEQVSGQTPGNTVNPDVPPTTGRPEKSSAVNPGASGQAGKQAETTTTLSEPRVFLSKTRVITSTLLKLQVADVKAAETETLALVRKTGGKYNIISLQNGNEQEIIRLVVPRQEAERITGQLAGRGKVLSQESEQQDITNLFSDTVQQYQALLAQRTTVARQEQLAQLENQIVALEKQLISWNEEAGQEVIMLWLEV